MKPSGQEGVALALTVYQSVGGMESGRVGVGYGGGLLRCLLAMGFCLFSKKIKNTLDAEFCA